MSEIATYSYVELVRLCCDGGVIYLIDFFFQAEDGIRDIGVTGVQTCAPSDLDLVAQDVHAGEPPVDVGSSEVHAVVVIPEGRGPLLVGIAVVDRKSVV